jgi:hypothetical protein
MAQSKVGRQMAANWKTVNASSPSEMRRRQKVEHGVHLEKVSAQVHNAWMEGKKKSGITSRKSEAGEEMMRPYGKLSHDVKDRDRQTVKAVWRAEKATKNGGGSREYHRDERGRFASKGTSKASAAPEYPVKGAQVTKGQIHTIGRSLSRLNKNGTIARVVNEGEKQAAALGRKKS